MERQITKHVLKLGMIVVLLSMVMAGCYYDNEEDLYQYYYQDNTCDTVGVSFSNDIMPIIQGNCATIGCHVQGGTGNGIFENYAGVKAKVDNGSLKSRVLVQKNMPPSQPLGDCSMSLISAWINAGAPNN